VLDDVERRGFLVQPARKHPLPELVGALDIELNEGPRQHFAFPRRGHFARAQAHNHVPDPHRLARLERQVADDAVTLVEQSKDGDAIGHRRHARLLPGRRRSRGRHYPLARLGLGLVLAPAAGGKQRQHHQ
jgi:hypothetical protein